MLDLPALPGPVAIWIQGQSQGATEEELHDAVNCSLACTAANQPAQAYRLRSEIPLETACPSWRDALEMVGEDVYEGGTEAMLWGFPS